MTNTVPQPPRGAGTETILQHLADTMVLPSPHAPAGCVLGMEVAGVRTVVTAGAASPELSPRMERSTLFDLASVSKVLGTTTCLHRLAGMRLLDVDTPVRRLIPSFGGADSTTVRDLLQHRGGLWDWQPLYLAPGGQENPFRVIDGLPLRYDPGKERHYSDLGFMTLGRVVEVVAAVPLAVAVRELVADPLALGPFSYGPVSGTSIATSGLDDRVERRMVATGEPHPVLWGDHGFSWRTGPIRGTVNDGNCAHAFSGVAGHAGLFSNVDGLLDVAVSLSTAENNPSMWDPGVTADFFAAGPDVEQALGWRRGEILLDDAPRTLLWHPGFTGTAVGFVPGAGLAIAFAANRLLADQPQPTTVLWQRVLAAVEQILREQE